MNNTKPYAITLDVGGSLLNKTGSWRTERPVYLDRLPPCNNTCPAGENIQQWLYHAENGEYKEAWLEIMKNNPFPAVMGRVCYHSCEDACNRVHLDDPVGINSVERFLGDQALINRWKVEPGKSSGKKIMIVGAGMAGLACAYHLRLFGHDVTIFESSSKSGGMVRYGIPKYRMPNDKLNAEIHRIEDMGVTIKLNTKIDDVIATKEKYGFDAVFLSIGAQNAKLVDIKSDQSIPSLSAIEILRGIEDDVATGLHGHVVVYGGGNTAIDVARSAVRMGAKSVKVVVRNSQDKMPAHYEEINEALEEGVEVVPFRSISEIKKGQLILEIMEASDGNRPKPTGKFESIEASVIVQALGKNVDESLLDNLTDLKLEDGVLDVDAHMMSAIEGVFAGGDMVPSERNVTVAIGHGKKAARNIDQWLQGKFQKPSKKHEIADHSMMNTWYYSDAPRTIRPMLDVVRRQSGFAEVVGNLDETNAAFEARRCMSCGNCFECDNCYGVCPDNAVIKLGAGKRFEFKYDYCKGCAMCATECPCGAIKMEPELI